MQIRAELAEGRLRLGSRLPAERALAQQFGVSRGTVREALRSLEHAGLVRLRKGSTGGAFISEHSSHAMMIAIMDMFHVGAVQPKDLTKARIGIELIIVREACTRANQEDLEELNRNILETEAASNDFPLRAQKALEFHRILARIAGNPILATVMNGLLDVIALFANKIGQSNNSYILHSRRRFMKYLLENDVTAAVSEMEMSLTRLHRSYLSKLESEKPAKRKPKAQENSSDV